MVPVRSGSGHIQGFIGRKVDDIERGPKYRNPTRTATFDKSQVLYTPLIDPQGANSTAVVVEGPLDALALAAAATQAHRLDEFWPCSTNGVTVSPAQAERVAKSGAERIVIAMDGDQAGAEGTQRWVDAVCRGMGRPAMVTRLPGGVDPAEWLATQGYPGLSAFDPQHQWERSVVSPTQSGRELVRALAARDRNPFEEIIDTVVPLSLLAGSPREAAEFLAQVESEMTQHGWDPAATAIPALRHRAMEAHSVEHSALLTPALAVDNHGPSL